jgi:hypothetical protein
LLKAFWQVDCYVYYYVRQKNNIISQPPPQQHQQPKPLPPTRSLSTKPLPVLPNHFHGFCFFFGGLEETVQKRFFRIAISYGATVASVLSHQVTHCVVDTKEGREVQPQPGNVVFWTSSEFEAHANS